MRTNRLKILSKKTSSIENVKLVKVRRQNFNHRACFCTCNDRFLFQIFFLLLFVLHQLFLVLFYFFFFFLFFNNFFLFYVTSFSSFCSSSSRSSSSSCPSSCSSSPCSCSSCSSPFSVDYFCGISNARPTLRS